MQNQNYDGTKQVPCPFCNTLNKVSAKFCRGCGKNISEFMIKDTSPKAVKKCPNCGTENSTDADFCKECGSRLAQLSAPEGAADIKPAAQANVCPNCGVVNNPGAVFCKECGSRLAQPSAPVGAADIKPTAQANVCPNCGAVNNPGAVFCKECGNRFAQPSVPEEAADIKPAAQANVCPNCGAVNNPGAVFCKECGGRLATGKTDEQPVPMAAPVPPAAPEPPKPVVEEPAPPVMAEPPKPIIEEPVPPVAPEPSKPVVEEPVPPAAPEPPKPIVEEPAPPVMAEPPRPIVEEAADAQPAAQMNVCPNCGAVNNPGAAFCKECGGRLATGKTDAQPFPMAAPVPPVAPEPPKPVVEEPVQPVMPEPPRPIVEEPVPPVMPEPLRPIVEEPVPPVMPEPPRPVVEEPVPPVAPEPPKPTAEEPEKSNKKMMIIGGVAALVIAAGAFFALKGGGAGKGKGADKTASVPPAATKTEKAPDSKSVSISFDVPKDTKVVLDGKDVSSNSELDVTVGPHDIQLTHPLLSLVYDQKMTVSNAGKLSPIREIKMSPDCKGAAEKAGLAMLNGILKQACDSDALKLDPALFTGEADKNGKLTAVHKAMRNYAAKNSLKSLPVESVNLGNLELINKDGGKKFSVKCPAEFSGTGANGKKLNYSAHITFDIQDGKLMVASLDSFKAQ